MVVVAHHPDALGERLHDLRGARVRPGDREEDGLEVERREERLVQVAVEAVGVAFLEDLSAEKRDAVLVVEVRGSLVEEELLHEDLCLAEGLDGDAADVDLVAHVGVVVVAGLGFPESRVDVRIPLAVETTEVGVAGVRLAVVDLRPLHGKGDHPGRQAVRVAAEHEESELVALVQEAYEIAEALRQIPAAEQDVTRDVFERHRVRDEARLTTVLDERRERGQEIPRRDEQPVEARRVGAGRPTHVGRVRRVLRRDLDDLPFAGEHSRCREEEHDECSTASPEETLHGALSPGVPGRPAPPCRPGHVGARGPFA